jgi:hypothetical protein
MDSNDQWHCAQCGATLPTPDSVCEQCNRQLAVVKVEPSVTGKRRSYGVAAFIVSSWGLRSYVKGGITGLLLDCLFLGLGIGLPLFLALFGASKLEQFLKPRFPNGASFMALTVALVIALPIFVYFGLHVLWSI